jgi:hypothetical protein
MPGGTEITPMEIASVQATNILDNTDLLPESRICDEVGPEGQVMKKHDHRRGNEEAVKAAAHQAQNTELNITTPRKEALEHIQTALNHMDDRSVVRLMHVFRKLNSNEEMNLQLKLIKLMGEKVIANESFLTGGLHFSYGGQVLPPSFSQIRSLWAVGCEGHAANSQDGTIHLICDFIEQQHTGQENYEQSRYQRESIRNSVGPKIRGCETLIIWDENGNCHGDNGYLSSDAAQIVCPGVTIQAALAIVSILKKAGRIPYCKRVVLAMGAGEALEYASNRIKDGEPMTDMMNLVNKLVDKTILETNVWKDSLENVTLYLALMGTEVARVSGHPRSAEIEEFAKAYMVRLYLQMWIFYRSGQEMTQIHFSCLLRPLFLKDIPKRDPGTKLIMPSQLPMMLAGIQSMILAEGDIMKLVLNDYPSAESLFIFSETMYNMNLIMSQPQYRDDYYNSERNKPLQDEQIQLGTVLHVVVKGNHLTNSGNARPMRDAGRIMVSAQGQGKYESTYALPKETDSNSQNRGKMPLTEWPTPLMSDLRGDCYTNDEKTLGGTIIKITLMMAENLSEYNFMVQWKKAIKNLPVKTLTMNALDAQKMQEWYNMLLTTTENCKGGWRVSEKGEGSSTDPHNGLGELSISDLYLTILMFGLTNFEAGPEQIRVASKLKQLNHGWTQGQKMIISALRQFVATGLTKLWGLLGAHTNFNSDDAANVVPPPKKKNKEGEDDVPSDHVVLKNWSSLMIKRIKATIRDKRTEWGRQMTLCELALCLGLNPWVLRDLLTDDACQFLFGEFGSLLPIVPESWKHTMSALWIDPVQLMKGAQYRRVKKTSCQEGVAQLDFMWKEDEHEENWPLHALLPTELRCPWVVWKGNHPLEKDVHDYSLSLAKRVGNPEELGKCVSKNITDLASNNSKSVFKRKPIDTQYLVDCATGVKWETRSAPIPSEEVTKGTDNYVQRAVKDNTYTDLYDERDFFRSITEIENIHASLVHQEQEQAELIKKLNSTPHLMTSETTHKIPVTSYYQPADDLTAKSIKANVSQGLNRHGAAHGGIIHGSPMKASGSKTQSAVEKTRRMYKKPPITQESVHLKEITDRLFDAGFSSSSRSQDNQGIPVRLQNERPSQLSKYSANAIRPTYNLDAFFDNVEPSYADKLAAKQNEMKK